MFAQVTVSRGFKRSCDNDTYHMQGSGRPAVGALYGRPTGGALYGRPAGGALYGGLQEEPCMGGLQEELDQASL